MIGGCSALPSAGPTASDIKAQEVSHQKVRYHIVDINERVVRALLGAPAESFRTRFKTATARPAPRIGVGDSLTVTVWEAASGGLFGSSPIDHVTAGSRSVTIPEQAGAQDGGISIPFAGRIPAAGRLPVEVQHTIEQRLAGKAIEPQAIVAVTKSVSNSVTVAGEVAAGARIPLSLKGDRLLDAIAAAGGGGG